MNLEHLSPHADDVRRYMRKAGQVVRGRPEIPSRGELLLRAKLILKEALETCEALGFLPVVQSRGYSGPVSVDMDGVQFSRRTPGGRRLEPNLEDIADGCADLSVVLIGTLLACGIPDRPLFLLVDQNNLEKFGPGHSFRNDGKLVKAPGHRPPDIAKLLAELVD